jgi:ribosomal protein S18 acetylase RimI-like enzyme
VEFNIRPYIESDLDAIVDLSLLAWEPVFTSFRQIFGQGIFSILYPDWREVQKSGVIGVCKDSKKYSTIVVEHNQSVIGFLSYELKKEEEKGEVVLLAVHPDFQNDGIGTELNIYALCKIKEAGMKLAVVETGGDESHSPARRSYEKAGYTGLPLVRYFKELK